MPFDGVEASNVTERLVIGRARIEAGWCQGHLHCARWSWHGMRHEYCLVGAIRMDLWGWQRGDKAAVLIMEAQAELGYGWRQPCEFNDSPGRTKAEVLEVLDRAIAMSRGEIVPPLV